MLLCDPMWMTINIAAGKSCGNIGKMSLRALIAPADPPITTILDIVVSSSRTGDVTGNLHSKARVCASARLPRVVIAMSASGRLLPVVTVRDFFPMLVQTAEMIRLEFPPCYETATSTVQIGMHEQARCVLVVERLFETIFEWIYPKVADITMYFPLSVESAAVEQCLLKLSPAEIERIYRLNN
jgi:hypothetical protein